MAAAPQFGDGQAGLVGSPCLDRWTADLVIACYLRTEWISTPAPLLGGRRGDAPNGRGGVTYALPTTMRDESPCMSGSGRPAFNVWASRPSVHPFAARVHTTFDVLLTRIARVPRASLRA